MSAFLYNYPAGIEGSVTRPLETQIEQGMLGTPVATKYGIAVKVTTGGKFIPFAGGESASAFYGILVRSVPQISGNYNQDFASNAPWDEQVQGIAVEGYVCVLCTVGTPTRGGTVYLRITAGSGKAVGDFEATADGGNSIALTDVIWAVEGKGTENQAEIRIAR